jgi:tRNA-modifying protein YgfZ
VRVKRAPSGRQLTIVNQAATKLRGATRPASTRSASCTSMAPSLQRRTARVRRSFDRAHVAPATTQPNNAARAASGNGTNTTMASVPATASARNASAAPLYLSRQVTSIPSSVSAWLSFLASRGAQLGAAGVAGFGEAGEEAIAARDHTILADLSHNALIAVSGDDATAFLHGQFTNDVQALPDGAAQWNGWCSAKGRLLATFLLVKRGKEYLLLLPAEIAPAIAKRLRMYVLRSKVTVTEASERFVRLGLAGKSAAVLAAHHWGFSPDPMRSAEREGAICVALDDQRFVVLADPARAPSLWEALAATARPTGPDAWEWTLVQAGIPTIVARTQEEFVPQMANFELVGGVSFRKGCYPGQEIVARTQYRGGLKRRMARVHVAQSQRPQPGDAVYAASFGEQAAGMVVSATPSPEGGFDALVVAQIDSLERDELRLGSPGGSRLEIRGRPLAQA